MGAGQVSCDRQNHENLAEHYGSVCISLLQLR